MTIEWTGLNGDLPKGRFGIVVSRYNETITEQLLHGAINTLVEAGVAEDSIDVVRVPGAWELPLPTARLARREDILAVVSIGVVIKGDTSHDQHINRSVCNALADIGLATDKPVLLGLLTCNTVDQAIERAGGNMGNKGAECASAALEMVRLMDALTDDSKTTLGFNR